MTRQEAIRQLDDLRLNSASMIRDDSPVWEDDVEALTMAIEWGTMIGLLTEALRMMLPELPERGEE